MWCDWKSDHMWYHFITECDEFGEYWLKTEKCEKSWDWCSNSGKNLGITKTCCDVLSIEVFKQNFESIDGQYTWTVLIFPRYCMQLCRVLKDNVFLDWKIRRSRKNYLLRKHFWMNFQRNNGQFLSKKVVSTRMNLIR